MNTYNCIIHLPPDVLEELGAHSGFFWPDFQLEPIICDAIRAYISPAPAAPAEQAATMDDGYQWKQLFLPDGTRLRASFGRTHYFAVVQGAEIRYGEQAVSPSGFANLKGSGNRNAWKTVWLRFPGSELWVLADVCRAQHKAAISRLFGANMTTSNAAPAQTPATTQALPAVQVTAKPAKSKSAPAGKRHKHGKQRSRRKHSAAARQPAS
ncbi:hypothetical protein [Duganella sacchari]|nr:hypothetical protein [Duganella sacchari]